MNMNKQRKPNPVISRRSKKLRLKCPSSRITTNLLEIQFLSTMETALMSYVDHTAASWYCQKLTFTPSRCPMQPELSQLKNVCIYDTALVTCLHKVTATSTGSAVSGSYCYPS